jgi:parvulin-like peptidyl-prolyl isomerase
MRARPPVTSPRISPLGKQQKPYLMSMLIRAVSLLLTALLVIAADAPPGADLVAQRGDVRLTGAELQDVLSLLDPAARAQVTATQQNLANFARQRVLNMAILAEAKAKKWDTQPDIVRKVAEARDAVVTQTYLASLVPPDPAYPNDADVAAAYESNKSRLVLPRQYHLAQIVLTVKPGATPQEDEEVHKKALSLRTQAARPNADFAELARKNSQDPQSAEKGGDVGWLQEPNMIPVVRDAVSGMIESGISQPVRVADGWHIMKLLAMKPAGPISLQDARPQIVAALRQARTQRLERAYLDDMLKAQPIQLNEIELAKQANEAAGK